LISAASAQNYSFELYTLSGQLIMQKRIKNMDKIDLNTQAGMYYYRVTDNIGGQLSGKLVVK
ncbi:MAG: T9SS type A sorting domain-containing protein, partial [Crocinitomicaceae bacterium]|nr:T9SS type A sorting domain-containing protein [Crocinitomicaceae bacterium]